MSTQSYFHLKLYLRTKKLESIDLNSTGENFREQSSWLNRVGTRQSNWHVIGFMVDELKWKAQLGLTPVETVSDCGTVETAQNNRYLDLNPDLISY